MSKKIIRYCIGDQLGFPVYCEHVLYAEEMTSETDHKPAIIKQNHYSAKPYQEKRTCGNSQKSVRMKHKK